MGKKFAIKRIMFALLLLSATALIAGAYIFVRKEIPDEINIVVNEEQHFDFRLPVDGVIYENAVEASEMEKSNVPSNQIKINMVEPFAIKSEKSGSYTMSCKLFGLFNLKDVKIDVVDKTYLIPCGKSIGIYIQTDGVLIIGTGTVNGMDGMNYEPAYKLLKSGDYIVAVNGEPVNNKNKLIELINKYGSNDIVVSVRRKGQLIDLKVSPVQCGIDDYKIGVWVRDNTQGIGTMTFVDEKGQFGALGHGINDVDTSTLMEVSNGNLYKTNIVSIIKGERGTPGELTGTIDYNSKNILGEITSNTKEGIFGISNQILSQMNAVEPLEVCMKQDIERGSAYIRSDIEGKFKDYEVEILEVNTGEDNVNKGIVLKVTDEHLLELTGGIVQGMSGSPIIQNNKIIGAVTHVFIQDSSKGFGIFIENMITSY